MKLKIIPLLILAITLLGSFGVMQKHFSPETNVSVDTGHLAHNYKNESQTDFKTIVDIDATITTIYSDAVDADIVYKETNNPVQHPIVEVNNNSAELQNLDTKAQAKDNREDRFAELTVKNKERKLTKASLVKNTENIKELIALNHIDYWQTVYSIESKQGKLLFRPRNKARSCDFTTAACGHHQLTVQALKDIGCKSLQCRKDRLDFKKSLELSKKLLALNEKRLKKQGISNLEGYQKYLIHQQGASGIKHILAATQGKNTLSKRIKKNMANNSPFSYKELKTMGSEVAANKFMQHWKVKWLNEKRLIIASQASATGNATASTDSPIDTDFIPKFDDKELNLALNIQF